MRRAVARGRLFPQSFSTDRRIGRLSLKACALFPLMWANADDQGRLCGDPEEVKYAVCPNIDHITKSDIPELLKELERNKLIKVYEAPKSTAIQLLDWWEVHKPQWAYPSQYSPPDGWKDRLRYHPRPDQVITENWTSPSQFDKTEADVALGSALANTPEEALGSALPSNGAPPSERENEKEKLKGKRRGRGNLRSALRSKPSPSLTTYLTEFNSLFQTLVDTYNSGWGRMPDSRETAQLRDLAQEISSAGGATVVQIKDAFKEAAAANKLHISYVRAILCDWLGIERNRSP